MDRNNSINLIIIALAAIVLLALRYGSSEKINFKKDVFVGTRNVQNTPKAECDIRITHHLTGFEHDVLNLEINPPTELNYKSKKEIYELRKSYVEKSLFATGCYAPSEEVFGQIEDGKPWWGDIVCYEGNNSVSRGVSWVSKFINNPNMLVATMATYIEENTPETKRYCRSQMSKTIPYALSYNKKENRITAKYHIPFAMLAGNETVCIEENCDHPRYLTLTGMNARDFGYKYIYIDKLSDVLMLRGHKDSIYEFKDYIHVGGSCGIPGGCNNISPRQPELEYYFTGLPARMDIKLWKNSPNSVSDDADINYTLLFEEWSD